MKKIRNKPKGSRGGYKILDGLTIKESAFVEALSNPKKKDTFGNKKAAALSAYNCKETSAAAVGSIVSKKPAVKKALSERLGEDGDIDELIMRGIRHRLQDPDNQNWMPTANFVARIRGDAAPERKEVLKVTADVRQKEYEDIAKHLPDIEVDLEEV